VNNRYEKNEDILNELEEQGLITFDEEYKFPQRIKGETGTKTNKHFNEAEVMAVILPYIVNDISISNRELERQTGLTRQIIGKVRGSEQFANLILSYTNKVMVETRALALNELQKLLLDKSVPATTKQKLIATALSHTEQILGIYGQASKELPTVSIDDLLIELEDFNR